MRDEDQRMIKNSVWNLKTYQRHVARLKEIINLYGWPTHNLVGEQRSNAAWLLAQHSDRFPAFQKRCLKLLKKAAMKNQASKEDLAYLTDRVLVHRGKKQLCGTQVYVSLSGKYGPKPIRDFKNIEQRRKEAGMQPFSEYDADLRKKQEQFKKK